MYDVIDVIDEVYATRHRPWRDVPRAAPVLLRAGAGEGEGETAES
ncbi:hypothetical protein QQY66_49750 [Streptomyces sp. DG2A-72]|nr:hypothetical protein [Streptomyces sp. DG2A-72]MDO0939392.1 hypothetical protein [Streptomyces sp. DG2A-72]